MKTKRHHAALSASASALVAHLLTLTLTLTACGGPERVLPFIEAGAPCGSVGHVDCSEFPNLTCSAEAGSCGRVVYGCLDAGYFADVDTTGCGD